MECQVVFSFNDNWFSQKIKRFLKKEYSHVALLFNVENEKIILHVTRHGVHALSWQNFQKHNKIILIKNIECQERVKRAFSYCIDKLGTPYGFLAILAIELGIHYEDGEKTLICSEYVARALEMPFDKLPDLINPAEIEDNL